MVPRIPRQCLTDYRAMLRGHSDSVSSILGRWYSVYLENVRQTTSTSGPLRYAQLAGTFKFRIPTNTQHADTLQHDLVNVRLTKNYGYPDSNDNGIKVKGKTLFCRGKFTLCCVMQFLQIKTLKISNTILFSLQGTTRRQKQPRRPGGFCGSHVGII